MALGVDTRWMEAASGWTALLWVFGLLLNAEPLADLPAYLPLVGFAPEWLWLALAAMGGAVQMAAARMDRLAARLLCTLVMGALYLLLAAGVRAGAPWSPVVPIYFGAAVQNMVAMLMLTALLLRRRRF